MIRSLLWMLGFLLALQHHQVAAAKGGKESCDASKLPAKAFYSVTKKNDYMMLEVRDPFLQEKPIWSLRLAKAELDQEYRLFLRSEFQLLLVTCFIDKENGWNRVCGYFQNKFPINFEDKEKKAGNLDTDSLGWYFKPFGFHNFSAGFETGQYYIDMSKIYFEEAGEDGKGAKIQLNEQYVYEFDKEVGKDRSHALVQRDKSNTMCFTPDVYCGYDLSWHRVVEEKQTANQDGSFPTPLYYYGPHKFYVSNGNFLHDNVINVACYGSTKKHEILLPYLSPTASEVGSNKFLKDFDDTTKEKKCPAEGELDKIIKELGPPKKTDDEYYDVDEWGNELGAKILSDYGNQCKDDSLYFYLFIVSAVLAGIITCLFIALIIIIVIAKKKMMKMGHRLPKKPWETQATEDNATLLDQTVGVTEATTVGGETSAYTTLAQK